MIYRAKKSIKILDVFKHQYRIFFFFQNISKIICSFVEDEACSLPFTKMDNGINQTISTNVAPSHGIVLIFASTFCYIKQPQVWPHRLTLLADL